MPGLWVFGYGSLVSPESFGRTLGRPLRLGVDVFEAELAGYGRRWNYGVLHTTAHSYDGAGGRVEHTLVALGLVESAAERVNGVVAWVEPAELDALDDRERHYDRVDVTADVRIAGGGRPDRSTVVYVPRSEAVEHYRRARDRGSAAVERRYWDLVDAAFASLGPDQHARYRATTPDPDVPVLDLVR